MRYESCPGAMPIQGESCREKERQELAAFAEITFTCSICSDVLLDEDLALIGKCSHQLYRQCLRAIHCPTHMISNSISDAYERFKNSFRSKSLLRSLHILSHTKISTKYHPTLSAL
ncbi:hypothetical protein GYMLUDRAFT_434539 [Collybiopsis luxurians FD-317 M1]|uniref:Uncharacterized protein n=1 Tax=Collybiopsis luxurians FD-317 M1 TaxID=944289 RepID=A0A0D0CM59_9AGAR|nr:hypothetical protein GYMLUDRAFT_434539 [Collybiopsis luxurians FD-317 M1]